MVAVRAWLSAHGIPHWRINQQGVPIHGGTGFRPGPHRGIADLLGILPGGRFLAVEVKKPGGKLTKDQRCFLLDVCIADGLGICVSSVEELSMKLAGLVSGRLTE